MFLLIAYPGDRLAEILAHRLRGDALCVSPDDVGSHRLTVGHDTFSIDGREVRGALLRSLPDATFSRGFHPADAAFSSAEFGATLLAGLHLPGVFAVNRYSADAWFRSLRWSLWRAALERAGVPLADFSYGAGAIAGAWLPWMSPEPLPAPGEQVASMLGAACTTSVAAARWLAFDGQPLCGQASAAVRQALNALRREGIRLCAVTTDDCDAVLTVDTQPPIAGEEAATLAAMIEGAYAGHLGDR